MLRALHETGIKIDIIGGRGIGALGAVLHAIDGAARLWEPGGVWRSDSVTRLYRWRWPFRWLMGLVVALLAVLAVPLGNADGTVELFLMRADGTLTRQLTSTPAGGGEVRGYALAGSANRVVFFGDIDPLGTNPSHRVQLFDIDADGTSLRQLTTSSDTSTFEVSISDDGARIAFAHDGDLTGGNPDLSWEIFTILTTAPD